MKITLKQWLQINEVIQGIKDSVKVAEGQLTEIALQHYDDDNQVEASFLINLRNQFDNIIKLPDTKPQSEWTGGDSSDPANHKLREPNCVGGCSSRRYFTEDEMLEVEAVHHGPCDWSHKNMTPTNTT